MSFRPSWEKTLQVLIYIKEKYKSIPILQIHHCSDFECFHEEAAVKSLAGGHGGERRRVKILGRLCKHHQLKNILGEEVTEKIIILVH